MATKQLNKEYANIMVQAQKAIGRKETVGLFHRADRIRLQISKKKALKNNKNTINK